MAKLAAFARTGHLPLVSLFLEIGHDLFADECPVSIGQSAMRDAGAHQRRRILRRFI